MKPILHLTRDAASGDRRTNRQRAFIGTLLVLCLLLAQWVGYAHAIAHVHGQGNVGTHAAVADRGADTSSGPFEHQKASGACAALDAAALGAGLCSKGLALQALHAPQLPPVERASQPWLPAFAPHFSTRAPPLNA